MTIAGWLFMLGSVSMVAALACFCFARVLRGEDSRSSIARGKKIVQFDAGRTQRKSATGPAARTDNRSRAA